MQPKHYPPEEQPMQKQVERWLRERCGLTNAFTSALKELDPVPQSKATAKLGNFFA
jgi:hypothetical protein